MSVAPAPSYYDNYFAQGSSVIVGVGVKVEFEVGSAH